MGSPLVGPKLGYAGGLFLHHKMVMVVITVVLRLREDLQAIPAVGKMPGRQVIVYDKRREAIDKHKMQWFKIWGIDPKGKSNHIWRIELRAGKKHFKDRWQLRTFADIEAAIGDVLKLAMEDIRYVADHQTDSNITRQQLHPLWEKASGIVFYAMGEHCAGLTVALAMTDDEIKHDLAEAIQATLDNRIRFEDDPFWKSHKRAGQRLHFVA